MKTPFEDLVKDCINKFHQLQGKHADLMRAAKIFSNHHWMVAFDNSGEFIGAMRIEAKHTLVASKDCVRIDDREWR